MTNQHFTREELERDNKFLKYVKNFIERTLENDSFFVYTNPEFHKNVIGDFGTREDSIDYFKTNIQNRRKNQYTPFEAYDTENDKIVAATFTQDYEGEGGGELQYFIIRFYVVDNGKKVGSIVGKDGFVKTGMVDGNEIVSHFIQFPIEYSSWDSNDYTFTIQDAEIVYPVYKRVPEFQSKRVIEHNEHIYNRINDYDKSYGLEKMANDIKKDKEIVQHYENLRNKSKNRKGNNFLDLDTPLS